MVTCFPIRMAGAAISISNLLDCGRNRFTLRGLRILGRAFPTEFASRSSDLSPRAWNSHAQHLRFERPSAKEAWSYNVVQRLTYLVVIFLCFPLIIWTGLAMSPAFESLAPSPRLWVATNPRAPYTSS